MLTCRFIHVVNVFGNSMDEAHGDIHGIDAPRRRMSKRVIRAVLLKLGRALVHCSDRFKSRVTPDNHWQLCDAPFQDVAQYIGHVDLGMHILFPM